MGAVSAGLALKGGRARPRNLRLTDLKPEREHPMQTRVAGVLRLELAPAGKVSGWGVVWYAIDHAHYGGEVPGIRIGRGIVAGVPDLFILWRGRGYFIELKAKDGIVSAPQQAVMSAILAGGGHVGIACSEWDVLRLVDAWHIPRAGRVHMPAVRALPEAVAS
jgi:hypothetical protein